jgi:hypothetical protein
VAQVNTAAKIAQYVSKRRQAGLNFLFTSVYPGIYKIHEVVNGNDKFPNTSGFLHAISSTNSEFEPGTQARIINAKNGNAKRKQIITNFLTKYASNKPV